MPYDSGAQVIDENPVINGDCTIRQMGSVDPNAPIAMSGAQYFSVIDMWGIVGAGTVATATITPDTGNADSHPILGKRGASFRIVVNNPDAVVDAGDRCEIQVCIEGRNMTKFFVDDSADYLPWGIQFWVKSSVPGIYGVTAANSQNTRSFVSQFAVPQANVWQFVFIPVPVTGFQNGATWFTDNQRGMRLSIGLMAGANWTSAILNEWQNSAGRLITANQVNFFATAANQLNITDLKVVNGFIAEAFRRELFATTLEKTQRYYVQTFRYGTFPVQNIGSSEATLQYRANVAGVANQAASFFFPTNTRVQNAVVNGIATFYNPNAANANWRNVTGAADSGAAATAGANDEAERRLVITNPQVAGDAVGDLLAVHASFDVRM